MASEYSESPMPHMRYTALSSAAGCDGRRCLGDGFRGEGLRGECSPDAANCCLGTLLMTTTLPTAEFLSMSVMPCTD